MARKAIVCAIGKATAAAGALAACSLALAACSSAMGSSKIEDGARRAVPVAICLKPLARHGDTSAAPVLRPEDYWSMILPSYDPANNTVDRSATDCSGRPIFQSPDLLQSEGDRTGPIRASASDVITGQGPDGFRVVWLRTHKFADGTEAGPIALVRAREAFAEVYAIGLYRGAPSKSRFGFERLGFDVLVTATDDGCAGVKGDQSCETTMTAYLMNGGQLVPAARIPTDRVENGHVPGVAGTVQFRLTATPVFQDRSIRVLEQLAVRDPNQGDIRKSELERIFSLSERSKLAPNVPSLWSEVVGKPADTPAQSPKATTGPAVKPLKK